MNFELKVKLLKRFGSQIVAARHLKISESRLSHLVRGHSQPTEQERKALTKAFGRDSVSEIFQTTSEAAEQRVTM
jgi:hypothetical protein